MSGVAVIRSILAASGAVTAVVPAARIMGGDLPINTTLPAISVKEIDSMPRLTITMASSVKLLHTERVQVTIADKGSEGSDSTQATDGYVGVKTTLKLILAACTNRSATVNGIDVDSIVPDVEGPDLFDEDTSIYAQSRDFIVKYRA